MFSRILVPLGVSRDWESLVPHLVALSRKQDCEILVLETVSFTETLFEMPKAFMDTASAWVGDTDFAWRYVEGVAGELRARGLRARGLVQIGEPVATISEEARRQKATLIALSVRGHRRTLHGLFQTRAQQVLRASPVPTYVVPASTPASSGDVLIPVDGSGESLEAVPPAAEFCRGLAGKLLFLHVVAPGSSAESARQVLDAARRRSEQEGVDSEGILREGDPAAEILQTSLERRAALIAMRSRLSPNDLRGPLGSVTVRVLRSARIPMLIVRKAPAMLRSAARTG